MNLLDPYGIEVLSDLGLLGLICILKRSKDTEWPSWDTGCCNLDPQAGKALCSGSLPLPHTRSTQGAALLPDWTSGFSSGRSLVILAEKWRYLSGNTSNLKTTECSRDTCKKKKKISLFCHLCWFRFLFILFLLSSSLFTVQVYKSHSFLDNPQF